MDLDGAVALVTGGASGIGGATAARLRDGGARVAVLDLQAHEGEGDLAVKCDVGDEDDVVAAVQRVGATRCLLVSDTGQRHNPLPSEALRVFAQTVFERGLSEAEVVTMTARNPSDLLELEAAAPAPRPLDPAWATRLGATADPCVEADQASQRLSEKL